MSRIDTYLSIYLFQLSPYLYIILSYDSILPFVITRGSNAAEATQDIINNQIPTLKVIMGDGFLLLSNLFTRKDLLSYSIHNSFLLFSSLLFSSLLFSARCCKRREISTFKTSMYSLRRACLKEMIQERYWRYLSILLDIFRCFYHVFHSFIHSIHFVGRERSRFID